jgi:hypothetical protein
VWLPVSAAHAYAALGNAERAKTAITAAEEAWQHVQPDEMDELGGICTFNQSRTLYYAADALAWLPSEAERAEDYSARAVDAYANRNDPARAFGDQAGSHADLAIAHVARRELEGAAEALAPVLDLPPEQRINGIIHSVQRGQGWYRSSRRSASGVDRASAAGRGPDRRSHWPAARHLCEHGGQASEQSVPQAGHR